MAPPGEGEEPHRSVVLGETYKVTPPLLGVRGSDGAHARRGAGIVDQHVRRAELGLDPVEEGVDGGLVDKVRRDANDLDLVVNPGEFLLDLGQLLGAAGDENDGLGIGSGKGRREPRGTADENDTTVSSFVQATAAGHNGCPDAHLASDPLAGSGDDDDLAGLQQRRRGRVDGGILVAVGLARELVRRDEVIFRQLRDVHVRRRRRRRRVSNRRSLRHDLCRRVCRSRPRVNTMPMVSRSIQGHRNRHSSIVTGLFFLAPGSRRLSSQGRL